MANKPQYIIVHHSITPRDLNKDITENSFNNTHRARGFPESYFNGHTWYIGYHYVIFGDGEVRQYRADSEVGAHTKEGGINFKSIGVCLAGDFDKEEPSQAQKETLLKLIEGLQTKYDIKDDKVHPHRKYATYKSCWGKNLPDDIMGYLQKQSVPHWSNKAMDWALEHEIISSRHSPDLPVSWGELVVCLKRLSEKIIEWTKK